MNQELRVEKFLAKVKVNQRTGCWCWTGMKNKTGYGQVKRDGRFIFAHRYSYWLHKGEIGSLFVLHKCDNRVCVNPDHLFLGTQKDNQEDMKRKGRHVHGERSPHAKLRSCDVIRMYSLHESGVGTPALGKIFGVTKNLAWRIVRGLQWEHLYKARYGE